jgi:hypothetical protein
MGRIRGIDPSVGMMLITLAFILAAWTLAVVVVTVTLPHAFHSKTHWPLVALVWVAPTLPSLSRRLRSTVLRIRRVTPILPGATSLQSRTRVEQIQRN